MMGKIVRSHFRPAWWLRNGHLQTLWPFLARSRPAPVTDSRRIELKDGDFIDLEVSRIAGGASATNARCTADRRVLVIHGLEGGLRSHYAGSMVERLAHEGFEPIFMRLRGTGDERNRLDRTYHSGASDDLAEVLEALHADRSAPISAVIGFSLGGNLLLKYLGEQRHPLVRRAVAVSVPFALRDAMLKLSRGFSRLYQTHLVRSLKRNHRLRYLDRPCPLEVDLAEMADFNDFDDKITAPLNGFDGVYDYYDRASSRRYLGRIETPTLILHAEDDPFMFPQTIPFEHELGDGVTLELSKRGGHAGFVSGSLPWRPVYWLEERIIGYLKQDPI